MAGKDKPRQEWLLDRQRSMIRKAASEGLSNLVHFALNLDEAQEVDPTQLATGRRDEDEPLLTACLAGHLDVVKNLVERCHAPIQCSGTITIDDVTYKQATPLWCAAASGQLDVVRYLVNKGAKIDDGESIRKSTPLRAAVFKCHVPVVKFLVQSGADVNSTNSHGHSVLMNACGKTEKAMEMVQFLLDNGADINYVVPPKEDISFAGWTALHDSTNEGNTDVAKLLIQRGATISRDAHGVTPLLIAAYKGHQDFVDALLDTPDCSRDDKADALELLGTEYLQTQDTGKCLSMWKRAMEERNMPGRPVARKREAGGKVAAYRNAVEVQTMAELRKLEARGDKDELRIQAFLIRERVLGPTNDNTVDIIQYFAAVYADEGNYARSVELLLHALSSLKIVRPFQKKKMDVYCFIVSIFGSMLGVDDENKRLRLIDVTGVLEMGQQEIVRGDKERTPAESPDENFADCRQEMLKVLLHLVALGTETSQGQASQQERERFSEIIRGLVQMDPRGKGGDTLLHMACNADTAELTYDGCIFPLPQVVQALLKAGSNVHARNEAGQTALQVAKAQTEADVSDVIEVLRAAGAR